MVGVDADTEAVEDGVEEARITEEFGEKEWNQGSDLPRNSVPVQMPTAKTTTN